MIYYLSIIRESMSLISVGLQLVLTVISNSAENLNVGHVSDDTKTRMNDMTSCLLLHQFANGLIVVQ